MAGANPNKTQRLIERTLRRRHNSKGNLVTFVLNRLILDLTKNCFSADKGIAESGAREKAYALSLACRHLPPQMYSAPGQKVGMVQDAVAALKRLGYHKRADECEKLLKTAMS